MIKNTFYSLTDWIITLSLFTLVSISYKVIGVIK